MRQQTNKKIWYILGLLVAIVIALPMWNFYRAYFGGRRIDVRQLKDSQHPLFAQPDADGHVNYLQRATRLLGEVPFEDDFLISALKFWPSDNYLFSDIVKAKPDLEKYRSQIAVSLLTEAEIRTAFSGESLEEAEDCEGRYELTYEKWVDFSPIVKSKFHAVSEAERPAIDFLLDELDRCQRISVPDLASKWDGRIDSVSDALPTSHFLVPFCDAMEQSDLTRAWRIARACFLLSKMEADRGCNMFMNRANSCGLMMLQAVLNDPKCDARFAASMLQKMPRNDWRFQLSQYWNIYQHAFVLQQIDWMVEGETQHFEVLSRSPSGWSIRASGRVPGGWIQSTKLADAVNASIDQQIATVTASDFVLPPHLVRQVQTGASYQTKVQSITSTLMSSIGVPPDHNMGKDFERLILSQTSDEVSSKRLLMNDTVFRLARTAIALKAGLVDDELQHIAPEASDYLLPEDLVDWCSGNKFVVTETEQSERVVYSFGWNQRDDGGVRDALQDSDDMPIKVDQ